MRDPFSLFKVWRIISVWMLLVVLSGCATASRQAFHRFSFDGWNDKWVRQIDLLGYSYGDQYYKVRREVKPNETTLGYQDSVTGLMPIADFLYVKWRVKATGEVVEDRVDLRGLLPSNMEDHGVAFVIDGKQLYVYLVTPEGKSEYAEPIIKTTRSRYYLTYEIYPANTFKR